MRVLKIYTNIIEKLLILSLKLSSYFEKKYSKLINKQINEVNKGK